MNKKLVIFMLMLIVAFIMFMFIYLGETDYSYEYKIDSFKVIENYETKDQIYSYEISGDNSYKFTIPGKYSTNRGKITNLTEKDNCLTIEGELSFYNICKDENNYYFPETKIKNETDYTTYKNMKIYDLQEKFYLIWNYNGFIYLNENKKEVIEIFDTETYIPSLAVKLNESLLIPDYDSKYTFDKFYMIDFLSGKSEIIDTNVDFDYNIIYTSYNNNIITMYDEKTSKEYELNLQSSDLVTKNKIIYSNSELKNINLNTEQIYFSIVDNKIKYTMKNFEIYLNDFKPENIIYQNKEEVIFLQEGKLYYFNIFGEINLVLENTELEFNNSELIFIY